MLNWITSHWFLLTMLSAVTALSFVYLLIFNKKRLNIAWWEALILAITHTVFGVITVTFWALMESGFNVNASGNMSLFGGIFLMPLYYVIFALIKKLEFKKVFDTFIIPLTATYFFARINCLYSGCCNGILLGSIHFPVREIELAYYAIFIIFTSGWILKDKSNGLAYPIYMVSYGALRFILEWLRESNSSMIFRFGHIWSIIIVIIGLAILIPNLVIQKKQRKEDKV